MYKEKEIKAYLAGELLPEVRMKYEIAEEMGLLDRVLSDGWKVCLRKRPEGSED